MKEERKGGEDAKSPRGGKEKEGEAKQRDSGGREAKKPKGGKENKRKGKRIGSERVGKARVK